MSCKKIKELYSFMYPSDYCVPVHSFAYTPMPVPMPKANVSGPWSQKQEGNNPMTAKVNFNTAMNVAAPATNIEATQRDFAVSRINSTKYVLRDALRVQFHMDAHQPPRTAKDLIAAIKNDEFILDEKALTRVGENELKYYHNMYGIIWGKVAPDEAGYKVALDALDEATQAAIDAATLAPVGELQNVLKDYQNWKYTPAS